VAALKQMGGGAQDGVSTRERRNLSSFLADAPRDVLAPQNRWNVVAFCRNRLTGFAFSGLIFQSGISAIAWWWAVEWPTCEPLSIPSCG